MNTNPEHTPGGRQLGLDGLPAAPKTAPRAGRAVVGPVSAAGRPLRLVRRDQQTGDGRYPIAWLTITAPRGATPTATSVCACGRNLFAAGHHKALALIADHTDHKTRCPLRADQEGAVA
ncbi:hypothetical protein ABZ895_03475 [Streptomyces californicus]|uniref:hypothetical protein n=1 Tax=Streptomyces californicus TaxID=67351 RepID=UPI0033C6A5EE